MTSTIHACLIGALCIFPSLGSEINTLTPEEKADGWKLVFNGKDLDNFRIFGSEAAPHKGWIIEDGILKKLDGIGGGQIITKEKYTDYILSWDWNIDSNGNSGLKYLVDESRPETPGPEYQMIDDPVYLGGKSAPDQTTAALYDILPASEAKILKPAGEWNTSKIVVAGKNVEHWLNGKLVLQYELESPELETAIATGKFKDVEGYSMKLEGHIMLTDHNDGCSFRNIKIRPGIHE